MRIGGGIRMIGIGKIIHGQLIRLVGMVLIGKVRGIGPEKQVPVPLMSTKSQSLDRMPSLKLRQFTT